MEESLRTQHVLADLYLWGERRKPKVNEGFGILMYLASPACQLAQSKWRRSEARAPLDLQQFPSLDTRQMVHGSSRLVSRMFPPCLPAYDIRLLLKLLILVRDSRTRLQAQILTSV